MILRMPFQQKTHALLLSALFCGVVASPFVVSAQIQSDGVSQQIRDEFRSALLTDSRALSLSPEALNAMVEALAGDVESRGAEYDFVLPPPPPLPDFVNSFEDLIATPWGPVSPTFLYWVVLVTLALSLLCLWLIVLLHRVRPPIV